MTTTSSAAIVPQHLPDDLKAIKGWVVWRLTQITGEAKLRKVPYYAASGKPRRDHGSADDRAQLATYEDAIEAAERGQYSGVGLAILPEWNIVALDFDKVVRDGEVHPHVAACVEGTYAELSPSGTGVRAFFKGSLPSRKDNERKSSNAAGPDWFGVEVFGTSGFVTVTGNVLDACALFGDDATIATLTPAVRELFVERWGAVPSSSNEDADEAWLLAQSPRIGLSLDKARELLDSLSPDCSYDDWLGVGQALHHEFEGSDEALDLFMSWSRHAEKPATERVMRQKWTSFGRYTGQPRSMAWVLKQVKDMRAVARIDALGDWKARIADTDDEFILRETLTDEMSKDTRLREVEREILAQALRTALIAKGTKLPIAQVRKLIAARRERAVAEPAEQDIPEWARGWVWVTDQDKFYRIDSTEWLTQTSFNARFNREIADADGHYDKPATWYALDKVCIPSVTRAVYMPGLDPLFMMDDAYCVNRYRPSSVPQALPLTDAGREAIRLVEQHIDIVTGGRRRVADILLSWLAYCVQHPGQKIRWAPLIKGVEGDGKTIIGKLMAAVMGHENVSNVSPQVLGGQFTGWAEGSCVVLLEEVRVVGMSKHDVFNALKPYITNESVPIHRKGRDEYQIANVSNQLGFTNFADALPLGDNDRRFFIIFTPHANRVELEATVKARAGCASLREYFKRLHAGIEAHAGELRRWLLDYRLSDEFDPDDTAPHTDEKDVMVAMSASPEEEAVRTAIEQGAEGVGRQVLSSSCLTAAMRLDPDADLDLQTSTLYRTLCRLGWSKVPSRVKWRGAAHRVWTRGAKCTDLAKLREMLDACSGPCASDEFFANKPDNKPQSGAELPPSAVLGTSHGTSTNACQH